MRTKLRGLKRTAAKERGEEVQTAMEFHYVRATKEGLLVDYDLETDYPEVEAAMFATLYGAASLVVENVADGEDPSVSIKTGKKVVTVMKSGENIVAVIPTTDGKPDPSVLSKYVRDLPEAHI